MASGKRNQKKERERRKRLYEKYGHLIGSETKDIPERHRAKSGGLRCFKRVQERDDNGNKIKDGERTRCGNPCSRGSLYCRHHGGANSKALVSGKFTNRILDKYKKSFGTKLGSVMEAFISDPDMMSHKNELATLRTILLEYIKKYSTNKPSGSKKEFVRLAASVIEADHLDTADKYAMLCDLVYNEKTITDDDVVDRIGNLIDKIGKGIERIDRLERKADYFLTPEGLKTIIRSVVETIRLNVEDPDKLAAIRTAILEIHTKTNGEIVVQNEAR